MNIKGQLAHLTGKGIPYWSRIGILIIAGILIGHWLTKNEFWIDQRYKVYQFIQNSQPRKPHPHRTAIVMIGDEEFWKGDLGGRVPIRRDYLAKLVTALNEANAALIALDFDLRSPSPEGDPVEVPAFQEETNKLLEAVKLASRNRTIVLPRTVSSVDQENYVPESDIYSGFDFGTGNVLTGYISLDDDTRKVPLSLPLTKGPPADSFSQAIVRGDNEAAVPEKLNKDDEPYGSYMNPDDFAVYPANQVLSDAAVSAKLAHKIVIVGANWNDRAFGRGTPVDSYPSPIGNVPGVFLHANYVEAMLDSRIYRPWKGWILVFIEVLQALLISVPFALEIRALFKVLLVGGLCLLLVGFSLISLMVFGLFFDFFLPVIFVIGHGIVEQVWEWKKAAAGG